jgi:hypothetical protein
MGWPAATASPVSFAPKRNLRDLHTESRRFIFDIAPCRVEHESGRPGAARLSSNVATLKRFVMNAAVLDEEYPVEPSRCWIGLPLATAQWNRCRRLDGRASHPTWVMTEASRNAPAQT